MNKPTIAELQTSSQYRLTESFTIAGMQQFILRELGLAPPAEKKPAQLSVKRLIFFVLLGVIGGYVGMLLAKNALTIPWWQLGAAIGGLFVLMPIHEAIHALVFKALRAPKVGFGYSVQSLMIYAYAQRFVVTLNENALVAVMPFLVITTGLVVAWLIWPPLDLVWGTMLLFHTLLCVGDYVLVQYAIKNRHRTMFTFDDLDEQKSYFYERTPEL
ncbi:hypothetical protein GCM10027299_20480 [Larkinella ripae]